MARKAKEVFNPALLDEGDRFRLKRGPNSGLHGIPDNYVGKVFIVRERGLRRDAVSANVDGVVEAWGRWLVPHDMMAPVDDSVAKPKCKDGSFNAGCTSYGNSVLVNTVAGNMKVSVGYIEDQKTFADARKELRTWARNMLRETMLLIDSAEAMAKSRGMIPAAAKGKAKNGRRRRKRKTA